MKFKGTPNMLVRDIRKKKNYRFDKDGFFETDDIRLARRMSMKFKSVEPQEFICSKCGRECKSALGLASHERACKGE